MLSGGAFAAAGVAVFFPHAWLVQVIVGVVVALAMLLGLRPTLLARMRQAPGYRNSISKLVGSTALTTRADRKSVVEGKRVSVRVAIGGRRFIKKKKQKK